MNYNNDTTKDYNCQVQTIIKKAQIKKEYNKKVCAWLISKGEEDKARKITECATMLGFTNIDNVAHIVKANFCRERICSVCAWRRQARFVSQMRPVLSYLSDRDYELLFVTLTVRNVTYAELDKTIDHMLKSYDRLLHNKKIISSWHGKIRSLELTYNSEDKTFHPHIHILVAVKHSYFSAPGEFVSQQELCERWKKSLGAEYVPVCDIRKVTDTERGAVETLKYAFKPSLESDALSSFFYILRGRRLVSFSGVFADVRKLLKLSSFEDILTDDIETTKGKQFECMLYKFDTTGGVYSFYEKINYDKEF
jgi:plasmid rolling circle replication initiator protein Rep